MTQCFSGRSRVPSVVLPALLVALTLWLTTGCASLSPDGLRGDVAALSGNTLGTDAHADAAAVAQLLARPVDAEAAVRIALLRNPSLQASLAALGMSDAERVQAGRLPNPHLSLGRFAEGNTREIERMLRFNVLGLVTLPWRVRWQDQQTELAKLQAAQDVVRLAADTRRAWVRAVAARQVATQAFNAQEAAEAGAGLAARMVQAGNFSRLQQAREQTLLADARMQHTRAVQAAATAREQLSRLMALEGAQLQYTLPSHLPPLPAQADDADALPAEARALRERLDVRAAVDESRYIAESLGYTRATGFINALEIGVARDTTWDAAGTRETRRGWALGLPLPVFDWGQAGNARAQALYLQSAARVRDVALRARSEARGAWAQRNTAYTLAQRAMGEDLQLQQLVQEETLLRYNGMLASVWQLLAEARNTSLAAGRAIDAQRDFWLADTDLEQVLSGTGH